MAQKRTVLFLCTGNSCRSQMAEGWARALKRGVMEAYSAGIHPRGLDPRAVKVMAEVGIDISGYRSKPLDEVAAIGFDDIVTLCRQAYETCPVWGQDKAKVIHVSFEDPAALAQHVTNEEEALSHYRRIRDEIRAFVEKLPQVPGD